MHNCPHYYLLANGTEFADFFHEQCVIHLGGLHPSVAHAVQSAMEHRFRLGLKSLDTQHDIQAMKFWTIKALEFLKVTVQDTAGRIMAAQQIEHVTMLVDQARLAKDMPNVY